LNSKDLRFRETIQKLFQVLKILLYKKIQLLLNAKNVQNIKL